MGHSSIAVVIPPVNGNNGTEKCNAAPLCSCPDSSPITVLSDALRSEMPTLKGTTCIMVLDLVAGELCASLTPLLNFAIL